MPLEKPGLGHVVICTDMALKPYTTHPSHDEIFAKGPGKNVELRGEGNGIPQPHNEHYDLRVIESLLIQSR
jgi:hypothetical protein